MSRLIDDDDERNQAIGMLNADMLATVVSRHFGCTRKTIERLRRHFCVTGNVADRPRSGRPRVTTAADNCYMYIVLQHLRNRRLTAAATGRQYGIHPQTVRNWLRQSVQPVRAYRPYFGQILTRRHRTARREWCRRHLRFLRANWDLILFSDECWLNVSYADGRERVYHRQGERFADALINDRAAASKAEWANLPAPFMQGYVNSMHRRITACIAQNGGQMRYSHISLNLVSLCLLIPLQMNVNHSCIAIVSDKLKFDFGN